MKRLVTWKGKCSTATLERTKQGQYVARVEGVAYSADSIEEACDGAAEAALSAPAK